MKYKEKIWIAIRELILKSKIWSKSRRNLEFLTSNSITFISRCNKSYSWYSWDNIAVNICCSTFIRLQDIPFTNLPIYIVSKLSFVYLCLHQTILFIYLAFWNIAKKFRIYHANRVFKNLVVDRTSNWLFTILSVKFFAAGI